MTPAEHEWDLKHTTYTPYLALTGELWGVCCEEIGDNEPRYNDTALYFIAVKVIIDWLVSQDYFSGAGAVIEECSPARETILIRWVIENFRFIGCESLPLSDEMSPGNGTAVTEYNTIKSWKACRGHRAVWVVHNCHYNDIIMRTMLSHITSLTIVYSTGDRWIPRTEGQ